MQNVLYALRSVFAIVVVAGTVTPAFGWNTISIKTLYPQWTDAVTGTRIDDNVNLHPQFNFHDQVFGNAQIQTSDDGEFLIMGYGDSHLGDTAVGDAIHIVKRLPWGTYERMVSPVLSFPPEAGKTWDQVGGFGNGAGFAKTDVATSTGYRYFSAVIVNDMHTRPERRWITWAVSTDGLNWAFAKQGGGTTANPVESLQLIRKATLDGDYWHINMMYNPVDGYFYVVFGLSSEIYITATWWRIKYTPANAFGLKPGTSGYEVERLQDLTYVSTDGVIPENEALIKAAQLPKSCGSDTSGAYDAVNLVWLTKSDGTFDSVLFLYRPESAITSDVIYYVRGPYPGLGHFGLNDAPRVALDTSPLRAGCPNYPCFSNCTAAGPHFGLVQRGVQADGSPRVFAYVTSRREDVHGSTSNCATGPAALLPVELELRTSTLADHSCPTVTSRGHTNPMPRRAMNRDSHVRRSD